MLSELDSEYPYLIVDARYEKVRENDVICSHAVLVAIGIDGERQVLGVEMAQPTSWKGFLLGLKGRGLRGIIFVVTSIPGSSGRQGKLPESLLAALLRAFLAKCAGLSAP